MARREHQIPRYVPTFPFRSLIIVTGQLTELSFHEGVLVKQGQLLFALDRRPFEAALASAEANMVRDRGRSCTRRLAS